MATWKTVQKIAARLPETEEGTSYGTPCFKVKGKLVFRLRDEGDVMAIYTGEKEELMASDPGIYFSTPHYDGYPMVLVRLPKISEKELREIATDAWRMKAPPAVRKAHPDL
jgi:hypothetical protein